MKNRRTVSEMTRHITFVEETRGEIMLGSVNSRTRLCSERK